MSNSENSHSENSHSENSHSENSHSENSHSENSHSENSNIPEVIDISNNKLHTIRHIVISGGGVAGFSFFGALRESNERELWNIENIQTIYGTSVGAMIAVILALNYDWPTIENYMTNRPWHNIFKFDMYAIVNSIQSRGILGLNVIKNMFEPLFLGKDIPINITIGEFYNLTKIEIHIFITDLSTFKLVDISYKTHPEWKVIDAVYASSALPIIFAPLHKDDVFYCDGGFLADYPIKQCIANGADPNEIMGFIKKIDEDNNEQMTVESTLFDYIMTLLNKTIKNIIHSTSNTKNLIPNEYEFVSTASSIYAIYNASSSIDCRIELIKLGKQTVIDTITE